ncbi:MerR family transcriptional regulator [Aneurinibacillus sp. Ricciae_BoGa-3]|uniref:MerR family transcriptional regulator n=1 Tax=Aneurinibacillus sp. Ricciae_BoGa-3 TaxID=3022697 RepID=UPI0023409534|nr:MerR family transcriptional regulator [Aneurinibacillus sp. Ricciae_BoGa-3]WCK55109.1 MerR family transcriptional regulator [Aneurinibacillus sp. Ricciae_BoGa-3]
MSQEKLLSVSDVSRVLGLEETTILFYRNKFERFIPTVGSGPKRRFYENSLDIFRFIQHAFEKDLNVIQIEAALSGRSKINQMNPLQQQKALLASASTVFKQVQDVMQEMLHVMEEMNRYREHFERREKELVARIEQLERQVKAPFWKRWFGL